MDSPLWVDNRPMSVDYYSSDSWNYFICCLCTTIDSDFLPAMGGYQNKKAPRKLILKAFLKCE